MDGTHSSAQTLWCGIVVVFTCGITTVCGSLHCDSISVLRFILLTLSNHLTTVRAFPTTSEAYLSRAVSFHLMLLNSFDMVSRPLNADWHTHRLLAVPRDKLSLLLAMMHFMYTSVSNEVSTGDVIASACVCCPT